VTIEAAMTTAWLCAACATSAEQPPSYPPGPDAYCTGCRCPLDAQERIAAALAELVRRSGHRPTPEGPTCGVDEAARILQTTANGIYASRKEVQTLEEFKKRFMQGYMTGSRLKASGVAHKETYWRLYVEPLLGKKRLDEITDEDEQRLKASMGKKNPKTVNNALTLLSKMLKVALEWKVTDRLLNRATPRRSSTRRTTSSASWTAPPP